MAIYHAAIIQLPADEGSVEAQKRFAISTPRLEGEMVQEVENMKRSRLEALNVG